MEKNCTIAVYIRLSLADEDAGCGSKLESNSIANQRMLIHRFLDEHPELSQYPRAEFVDDGYTGTNFRRPQFMAMMEKVQKGEINLICTKDFSRFSRDYIEIGNYLEYTFPFMGVRFISINDGYDSEDYKGTTGGLEVVMRNIIYAAYSKDLSVKTTTAKIQMMKQGKYVGAYAPYGYILHPTIRNKLALNPEAAAVVRRIFDEALEGRNTSQIARSLNDDGIPTPGQYFRSRHPGNKKYNRMSEKVSWTAFMVYKLLTRYIYTGATVGHKRESAGVGSRKTVALEKKDWIVVEGMHEAIVSRQKYEQAQKVIRGGMKNLHYERKQFPLKGLVRCGNCKRAMSRRKLKNDNIYFYQCNLSTHDRDTECPVGEKYSETMLEGLVCRAIEQFLDLAERRAIQNHEVTNLCRTAIRDCTSELRALQTQSEQCKGTKFKLYETYTSGAVSKAEYLQKKSAVDTEIEAIQEAIRQVQNRMQEFDRQQACPDDGLEAMCENYRNNRVLTYELAHAMVSAIYIHAQDNIEIVWKFRDIFDEGNAK